MDLFQNVSAPRSPNFKPPDEIQLNAGGILKEFPLIEAGNISAVDDRHRQRLRTLVGIDEMLADILALLDDKGALHNTYGKNTLATTSGEHAF